MVSAVLLLGSEMNIELPMAPVFMGAPFMVLGLMVYVGLIASVHAHGELSAHALTYTQTFFNKTTEQHVIPYSSIVSTQLLRPRSFRGAFAALEITKTDGEKVVLEAGGVQALFSLEQELIERMANTTVEEPAWPEELKELIQPKHRAHKATERQP